MTCAYWMPKVAQEDAKEHPAFAYLRYAGPWGFYRHPNGGTMAVWGDWPEPGQFASHNLSDYGEPEEVSEGLHFLPAKVLPRFYDLARDSTQSGVDVTLACGLVVTIPCALVSGRQLRLGRGGRRAGMVTEYGKLALELLDVALVKDESGERRGIPPNDPRLPYLLALAIGQRYRSTPELLDQLELVAADDIEPLLGAIWSGNPKVERPADAGGPPALPSSASTTPS